MGVGHALASRAADPTSAAPGVAMVDHTVTMVVVIVVSAAATALLVLLYDVYWKRTYVMSIDHASTDTPPREAASGLGGCSAAPDSVRWHTAPSGPPQQPSGVQLSGELSQHQLSQFSQHAQVSSLGALSPSGRSTSGTRGGCRQSMLVSEYL